MTKKSLGLHSLWITDDKTHCISNALVAASLALLIEGEGSIQSKRGVVISIQMTDKEPVTWAAKVINRDVRLMRILPSGKKFWGTRIQGDDAKQVLRFVLPHLLSKRKRKQAEVAIDRKSKRWLSGESSPHHKLNANDVANIRALSASGSSSYSELSSLYGVTKSNICLIVQRKTWKHI
jgi:hypothetical protein